MSIKSFFAIPFAQIATKKVKKWANNPIKTQEKVFQKLISKGSKTVFGKDHDFSNIHNYEDFKKRIKVQDYEGLRAYVDRVVAGESNVLWPGKPLYFAKTSGTTSGAKYIPITKDSMPTTHKGGQKCVIVLYCRKKGCKLCQWENDLFTRKPYFRR